MNFSLLCTLSVVFAAGIAEAALFVYRPEKFKLLPWIVLAIMGIIYISYFNNGDEYFKLIGAIPIVSLLILQIVRTDIKQ